MPVATPCIHEKSEIGKPLAIRHRIPTPHSTSSPSITKFDYTFISALLLLTYLALKTARLPFRFDLAALAGAYFLLPLSAVFVAIVLSVIGLPWREILLPALLRFHQQKRVLLVALMAGILMIWSLGPIPGLMMTVEALGLAEFMARREQSFESGLLDVLIPGIYLFCGLVAVFGLNHAIVGIRYGGTYDTTFDRLDLAIFHVRVSYIANWSLHHLPGWVFTLEDKVYFSIWSRMGAALILSALLGGRQHAVKHVRALLICYSMGKMSSVESEYGV